MEARPALGLALVVDTDLAGVRIASRIVPRASHAVPANRRVEFLIGQIIATGRTGNILGRSTVGVLGRRRIPPLPPYLIRAVGGLNPNVRFTLLYPDHLDLVVLIAFVYCCAVSRLLRAVIWPVTVGKLSCERVNPRAGTEELV